MAVEKAWGREVMDSLPKGAKEGMWPILVNQEG